MKKNDQITLEITGLGKDGEGVGHYNGMALFVPGALPGDVITAGITKLKKSYGYARIVEILTPSKNRVEAECPVANRCGGCQIMNLSYPAQLSMKQDLLRDDLVRLGGFDQGFIEGIMEPIIGMSNPYHYRNKAQYPVGRTKDGEIQMGFYARHSHRIIEPDDRKGCLLGNAGNTRILLAVKSWMYQNHILPYDERTGKGLIRHILIRQGVHTDQTMVCLVANGTKLPDTDNLVKKLREADSSIVSIVMNINHARNNVILGAETRCIWGEEVITDTIGDVTFDISAQSFFQVNPEQMEKLYSKALAYAGLTGTEEVYDLYCGIGTISLFLAKAAGHVTGIEIVPSAIRDAHKNARYNQLENTDFYVGATEDVLPKIMEQRGKHADVIVLDPPRKGCEPSVIDTILAAAPEKVVYVSCDPATLSRDLKLFCADGSYELKKVCPVDQFPHTMHVETVVLMSRVDGK
jgi:23S rRNA (uracil1939-C5)-methyltransferase